MKLVQELKIIKTIWVVMSCTLLLFLLLIPFFSTDEVNYEQATLPTEFIFETWSLENFDDITVNDLSPNQRYESLTQAYKKQFKQPTQNFTQDKNIALYFFPVTLEKHMQETKKLQDLRIIIFSSLFESLDLKFDVELYEAYANLRGRFEHNTLKFFNIKKISREELVSLFIHEFAHYFDIKYFEKQVLFDVSDRFYEISWDNTKTLKSWSQKWDFVSGYAMTNKYEDFAETFTYYVLFNNDFRQKKQNSIQLQQKYAFFEKYVFRNDEFKKTNFRSDVQLADYYRDTTKIKISLQNFLDYFKK